ncbi:MAG: metallophosphoesterase family protein [Chloroflexi bacterium]|nr:metallophosphoesterase family protein [Chloroflexota bacterium]
MRYAIISDIHANLAAFKAVLEDTKGQGGVDKVWCLGDVVGYGPDPHECIETLRRLDHICVAGNHDLAAIGRIDTSEFNPEAAAACEWTAKQLSAPDMTYLEKLPLVIELALSGVEGEGDFTLVHGSPRDPVWEYITSTSQARENFAFFKTRFCLVGHSHVPLVFTSEAGGDFSGRRFLTDIKLLPGRPIRRSLDAGGDRMIINPGGVGQPRDGDPQASYALYDSETRLMVLRRVPYDIRSTQDRMAARGLPESLVRRLSYGM